MSFHTSVYPLCIAMANELHDLRHQLEALAERLCMDEHFCANHIESLQLFDSLTQHSEESALLLERLAIGMQSYEAITLIRLGKLQERLATALAHMNEPEKKVGNG